MPDSQVLRADGQRSPQVSDHSQRVTGLDALRAAAAVLVVMLHAAHAYIPYQMPGLVWPAHDPHPSELVDAIFWWIEGFIMPLFLFLSGYFAFGLLERLGPRGFLKHRRQRILYPLMFGCVCILPLDLYAWAFGIVLDGRAPWLKLRSLKFDAPISEQLWGLSHLWYLQYVFLYGLILIGGRWLLERRNSNSSFDGKFQTTTFGQTTLVLATVIVLATAGAATLFVYPEVVIGFQHSFFPVVPKFVYSGLFFVGGSVVATVGLPFLKRAAPVCLVLSVVPCGAMIALTREWFETGHSFVQQSTYAIVTASFAWLTVLGLVGSTSTYRESLPAGVQRLAAASFWIYLLHHPVVGLLQALLGLVALPAALKFGVVTSATLVICLMTYETMVRSTWIGRILNGPPRTPREAPAVESPRPARAA